MDPYLEDTALWEGFHNRFIGMLDEMLSARVPPQFYVEDQSSDYIVAPNEIGRPPLRPDVYLVAMGPATSSSAVAVADRPITRPAVVTARYPEELRQRYLEVRDRLNHTVVAVLELLSPTNKSAGTASREAFVRKRFDMMAAPVHWIEIDLLRAGERPPEVAGRGDYYALLKRSGVTTDFAVWDCNLRDPLPVIAVPLTDEYPDVAIDLQEALSRTYARYYARRMTYQGLPPPPPLQPADAAWLDACIQRWRDAGTLE
jgi:hypothetical protein